MLTLRRSKESVYLLEVLDAKDAMASLASSSASSAPARALELLLELGRAPEGAFLLASAEGAFAPVAAKGVDPVVLEAWAYAKPVLMTPECNLPEGFTSGASLECGFETDAIADGLARAFALTEEQWGAMADAAFPA